MGAAKMRWEMQIETASQEGAAQFARYAAQGLVANSCCPEDYRLKPMVDADNVKPCDYLQLSDVGFGFAATFDNSHCQECWEYAILHALKLQGREGARENVVWTLEEANKALDRAIKTLDSYFGRNADGEKKEGASDAAQNQD